VQIHRLLCNFFFKKNCRCPKLKLLKSVECSIPRGCSSVQCAALEIVDGDSMGYYGPLLLMFEHSPDCTCCDFGHLRFLAYFVSSNWSISYHGTKLLPQNRETFPDKEPSLLRWQKTSVLWLCPGNNKAQSGAMQIWFHFSVITSSFPDDLLFDVKFWSCDFVRSAPTTFHVGVNDFTYIMQFVCLHPLHRHLYQIQAHWTK
jgi:hypothetical protein